jgi:hypothetical protein
LCEQIYGPESSGKTTLAMQTIASVQKTGGIAVLLDAEHAFNETYSRVIPPFLGSHIRCAHFQRLSTAHLSVKKYASATAMYAEGTLSQILEGVAIGRPLEILDGTSHLLISLMLTSGPFGDSMSAAARPLGDPMSAAARPKRWSVSPQAKG